jgi:hypothetical protein
MTVGGRGEGGPRRAGAACLGLVFGRIRHARALRSHVAGEEGDGGASALDGVAEGDALGVVGDSLGWDRVCGDGFERVNGGDARVGGFDVGAFEGEIAGGVEMGLDVWAAGYGDELEDGDLELVGDVFEGSVVDEEVAGGG